MKQNRNKGFWRSALDCVLGTIALAVLTFVCFHFDANPTTVALLYLIVVVVPLSLMGGFVSSVVVSLIAYLLLDSFFTEPLYRPAMNQPLDLVAPVAYIATAFVISRLLSKVRKSIEDQRRAEEALRKSQAEMAHVTRLMTMGELATSIAHEINQPLSAIVNNGSACLRWLAADPPNLGEANEAAKRIVRDGSRAGEIISRIRAFLQKTDAPKVRMDINQIIEEVVVLTQSEARGSGVTLRVELADDLPPVSVDRVQLQQVILNLMVNGIEATASTNGQPRELIVSSRRQESDHVLVAIQDSGIGIDDEDLDKIFDAFYTTKSEGMGMGLAISRSIVEDHGGRLWAEPNGGSGATFQFTIKTQGI